MMDKNLQPDGTLKPNHLAEAEAPTRAVILRDLPKPERLRITENLVEAAMTMGLMDDYQIKQWLGLESIGVKSIRAARENVTKKWLEETTDIFEYAKTQRATQIKKAWEEVRTCEDLFRSARSVADKVKVKQLQLQWMMYVSKLGFVDKMVESAVPDMQIVVNGSLSMEEEDGN